MTRPMLIQSRAETTYAPSDIGRMLRASFTRRLIIIFVMTCG